MKWEYQIARADTVEDFVSSLNKLGSEGWEAISGAYATGVPCAAVLCLVGTR